MNLATIEADFETLLPTIAGLGPALTTAAPLLELIFPQEAPVIAAVAAALSKIPTAAPNIGKDLNTLIADVKALTSAL